MIGSGYTHQGNPQASSNISIRNFTCDSPTSAGICIGSEMSGNVTDVHVRDSTFVNTGYAFRLKTGMGRGGAIERISYTNCTVHKAGYAFFFGETYGGNYTSNLIPREVPKRLLVLAGNPSSKRREYTHAPASNLSTTT